MNSSLRSALLLLTLALIQYSSIGQTQRYLLKIRGGEYVPEANADRFQPQSEYMTRTAFSSHHYVVLQFQELPSYQKRQALSQEGIELLSYIPELSYTARLRSTINPPICSAQVSAASPT